MSSVSGNNISVSLFGQSHSPEIGVVIDGLPAGLPVDCDALQIFLNRRAPGLHEWSTKRCEPDRVEIVTGLYQNCTCGAPLMARIKTCDAQSKDYDALCFRPRPGHADFAAYSKFGSSHDVRGGGHFSGRITAALCIAGGLCKQFLESNGVYIGAHIQSLHGVHDEVFQAHKVTVEQVQTLLDSSFPVLNLSCKNEMLTAISQAAKCGDSVGGIIECAAVGLPAGIGEPHFHGVENEISSHCFAIPGIKGIEFGDGFGVAGMLGSQNNDDFAFSDGHVVCETNHAGGILGGITTGMPVVFRVACKPTPSIAQPQHSVDLIEKKPYEMVIEGRHDPSIVLRAVPVVEAACALALYDLTLSHLKDGVDDFRI